MLNHTPEFDLNRVLQEAHAAQRQEIARLLRLLFRRRPRAQPSVAANG